MLGSFRSNVTAGLAVLAGIAGLSYVLAASAAPPGGTTTAVEFTPDGKLKRPVGYRNWVYVGEVVTPNDMNDGEATFPEFHSVYMDPESFAEYEKTGSDFNSRKASIPRRQAIVVVEFESKNRSFS
jgi:hypothetical protein